MNDSSIAKAKVQRCCSFNSLQRAVDDLYPVRPGLLRPRLQIWLGQLYHVGSCGLQAFYLLVFRGGAIQFQTLPIAAIAILRLLAGREKGLHRDLDSMAMV